MKQSMRMAVTAALLYMCPAFGADASRRGEAEEIRALQEQLAAQRAQIDELRAALEAQAGLLDRLAERAHLREAGAGNGTLAGDHLAAQKAQEPAPRLPVVSLEELARKTETGLKHLGGFQFSGDFRYRLDMQLRSANEFAAPLQNIRSRYRLRMNIDKDLDPRFRFHMQLSTGPINNIITNDQDMAGLAAKHPFSIAEAYINFHLNSKFSMRGGRMEEVFADNMRFLWDDDVRFNGFQQIVKVPLESNSLGFTGLELRAAQYILTNPAVYVLPANSPFVAAGYQPGEKVRTANLFHPGAILRGNIGNSWSHQILGAVELYRNPNQIQLASTATGFPVVVSGGIGLALSGPIGATGNGVTQPGGAIYSAPDFQVVHAGYRLERKGIKIGNREMPAWFDVQASRNTGASQLRDALMASVNLGSVKQAGDVRALYQFAIKDANSMISQFTDDDLGTGSGVNIAVHAMRLDIGLTRFLQLQNLVFFQRQRRASNPAEQFFVPLGRGANTTTRYLGQLAFSF